MEEQWNRDGGSVEQIWWNGATVIAEQKNSYGGTEEQLWWNSGTEMVEQSTNDGGVFFVTQIVVSGIRIVSCDRRLLYVYPT